MHRSAVFPDDAPVIPQILLSRGVWEDPVIPLTGGVILRAVRTGGVTVGFANVHYLSEYAREMDRLQRMLDEADPIGLTPTDQLAARTCASHPSVERRARLKLE